MKAQGNALGTQTPQGILALKGQKTMPPTMTEHKSRRCDLRGTPLGVPCL